MPKSRFAHFSYEDRQKLNSLLNDNLSFRKMSLVLGCSPSSITNEIKGHRIYKDYSFGTSKRKCFSERLIKAPFVCNGCRFKTLFNVILTDYAEENTIPK